MKSLLERHFDTAFDAPDGIKRLRELILNLAMQGKLVKQDPNDPPASELLKEIEAEKERLVKADLYRSNEDKVEDIGTPSFKLTINWQWTTIQQLGFILGGKRLPKGHSYSETPTKYRYLTVTNMKDGTIVDNDVKYISQSTYNEIKRYIISKNDIYITIAGTIGVVGTIPEQYDGMNLTENASRFVLFKCDKRFLVYLLSSRMVQDQFSVMTNKMAQPKLSLRSILSTGIPLPPLAEQHRIVAKIDQLMARCDALEKLRAVRDQKRLVVHAAAIRQLLDPASLPSRPHHVQHFLFSHFPELYAVKENVTELRKAILQLAVMGKLVSQDPNDPPASELLKEIDAEKKRLIKAGTIKQPKPLPPIKADEITYALPKSWQWVRMGELCNGVTSGSTPAKNYFHDTIGVPFLKVYNIRNQKIDFEYRKQFIDPNYHSSKMGRSKLVPGNLIMNIVGPPLGKIALIPDDYPEYNCNQAIVVFRPIVMPLNKYLYVYLLAGTFLNEIELVGTAGQDNISVTKSQLMPIPLPPLAEQHRIVAKIDQLMALCDAMESQITSATDKQTALLTALMARV